MFGYVRPALNRLSEEDRASYQSAYCGLCHAMGRRHGFLTRFTLNYDFAFLAILISGGRGVSGTCAMRCPVHPIRRPQQCLAGAGLDVTADESVILTWYKLTDDVQDHGLVTGLPYRLILRLFRRAYRRAALARPCFDQQVGAGMERLRQMEKEKSPRLDRVADAFAGILAAAGAGQMPDESSCRAMEQMLYHLGRWIYLADAWDDLDEDRRRGRYNPLDARFSGRAKEERAYVETTLTHSSRLAAAAANLIDFGKWTPVVENVLYFGLPAVQTAVLDGRWKEMRKVREKQTNERSV